MSVSSNSILKKNFIESSLNLLSPNTAISLPETTALADVISELAKNNFGCILLTDSQGNLSGIFSERDLILKRLYLGHPQSAEPVKSFMTVNPQCLKANASIARAIHLMSIGGFRHVPILPQGNTGLKITSTTDLFKFLYDRLASKVLSEDTTLFFDQNSVDEFFLSNLSLLKLDAPLVVSGQSTIEDVAKQMSIRKTGVSIILDDRSGVAGIFTERDFVKKVALKNQDVLKIQVQEAMTPRPVTLMSNSSIAIAFESMVIKGFRHLPVVGNDEKIEGILSVKNFINYLANQIVLELGKK